MQEANPNNGEWMSLALRPVEPEDEAFLCLVYASTRAEELTLVDWTAEQKAAFVLMQFTAQSSYYREHYSEADFGIILYRGSPVGRLYVARGQEEIRIVDIALLPEHRNAGIGSALLKEILAEAERESKVVTIHVEQFNPALRLYQRLGFTKKADQGVYYLMEWLPSAG